LHGQAEVAETPLLVKKDKPDVHLAFPPQDNPRGDQGDGINTAQHEDSDDEAVQVLNHHEMEEVPLQPAKKLAIRMVIDDEGRREVGQRDGKFQNLIHDHRVKSRFAFSTVKQQQQHQKKGKGKEIENTHRRREEIQFQGIHQTMIMMMMMMWKIQKPCCLIELKGFKESSQGIWG